MGWSGIEVFYTPGSPHCRAVLMCIKALNLEVDLTKLDMYQKFEHRKPWFVKVRKIKLTACFKYKNVCMRSANKRIPIGLLLLSIY